MTRAHGYRRRQCQTHHQQQVRTARSLAATGLLKQPSRTSRSPPVSLSAQLASAGRLERKCRQRRQTLPPTYLISNGRWPRERGSHVSLQQCDAPLGLLGNRKSEPASASPESATPGGQVLARAQS